MKTYSPEKKLYIEQMTKLLNDINEQYQAEKDKLKLTPELREFQNFIIDTHKMKQSDMHKENRKHFQSKDGNDYSYQMSIRCLSKQGAFFKSFTVPRQRTEKVLKATYVIKKLIEHQEEYGYQVYMSACSFYAPMKNAKFESFAYLKSLFCDLDNIPGVDFTNMSGNDIVLFLRSRYAYVFEQMPLPDYITVSSKSGLHLYWLLTDYAVKTSNYSNVEMWRECGAGLIGLFNTPECDVRIPKDTQRILRMPTSYNLKEGKYFKTRLINLSLAGKGYPLANFHEVLKDFIPAEPEPKPKKERQVKSSTEPKKEKRVSKRYPNVKMNNKIYMGLSKRLQDLQKYYKLHREDMTGHREEFFFQLYNTMKMLRMPIKSAQTRILALNRGLSNPLPESEIRVCIFESKKGYFTSKGKLAKNLGFTEEDKAVMSCNYDSYDKAKSKRQNIKRRTERGVHQKKIKQLLTVLKKGHLTNEKLAEVLDCSVRTVQRLRTKIKRLFSKAGFFLTGGVTKMTTLISIYFLFKNAWGNFNEFRPNFGTDYGLLNC